MAFYCHGHVHMPFEPLNFYDLWFVVPPE